MQKMTKNNKGFTLVELIVVIAILGVLAAVLVPQYIQYVEKSRQSTDATTLSELQHAADLELAMLETAPTSEATLFKFTVNSDGVIKKDAEAAGSFADQLLAVIGTGTLKSKASAGTYTLVYDATNKKADWDAISSTKITALKAGTATVS